MSDICMCEDKKCPSRTLCYRFTAEKCEYRQSYFAESPRKKGQMCCSSFWNNDSDECECDAMGIEHKRSKICEDYLKKMDKAGIKSQEHILKEMSEKNTYVSNKKRRKK
jgi:hypothetical protein